LYRQDNPELSRKILDHLANLYKIKEVREPNHLSSYVYCRTRGFFDQKQAIEPTDEEVMLFALGYGLQDVLTPKDAAAELYKSEGIIYRPDMTMTVRRRDYPEQVPYTELTTDIPVGTPYEVERLQELKTTRRSAKKHYVDEEIPVTWLAYMMGGCKIRHTNQYDLIVLYMMGNYAPPFPQLYTDTFTFTDEEIEDNWTVIKYNKGVLDTALAENKPPTPFQHCLDWECKSCRYKLVCETLSSIASKDSIEEDKKLWD